MTHPPIRILCLHGYTQSGPLFNSKTGALRKALATALSPRPIELHYPTGPLPLRPEDIPGYEAPAESSIAEGTPAAQIEAYGWWRRQAYTPNSNSNSNRNNSNASNGSNSSLHSLTGLPATLNLLAQTITDHGPFDGVLGFSQGACLAGMMCSLLEKAEASQHSETGEMQTPASTSSEPPVSTSEEATFAAFLHPDGSAIQPPFKFAVLFSGFKTPSYGGFWERRIRTRSLHVLGSLDVVVDEGRSQELVECFEGAEVVVHPGGHFVPSAKVWVGGVTAFVRRCLDQ